MKSLALAAGYDASACPYSKWQVKGGRNDDIQPWLVSNGKRNIFFNQPSLGVEATKMRAGKTTKSG